MSDPNDNSRMDMDVDVDMDMDMDTDIDVDHDHVPRVLFVCVHNAGRSQMAAALLERCAGARIEVRSAGTAPTDTINPAVVEVMNEIGIDLLAAGAMPKLLTDTVVSASDVVITMGCGDECPFHPGKRYLDWQLRAIRDEIDQHVQALVAELLEIPPPSE